MIVVGLLVAGALGAVLRHVVDRAVQRRQAAEFPLGILVVNLTGSLALGVLVGAALHHGLPAAWLTVAGTGLIGSYTTFSTFAFDAVRLAQRSAWASMTASALLGLAGGLGMAALGLALSTWA